MGALLLLVASIGMAVDASNIGYDSDDVPGFAPGPVGWFFFTLLLPILAVPIYLIRRPALRAAAQQRRLRASGGMAALPGAIYPNAPGAPGPYGAPGNPYGGRPAAPSPYGPPAAPSPYGAPTPYAGPPPQAPYGGAPGSSPYPGPPPQAPYGAPAQGTGPYGAVPPQPGTGPYGAVPPQAPPTPQAPAPPSAPAATPQPPAAKPAAHAGSSGSMTAGDLADGIRQLSDLRDRGLLTESEFQARKAALLRKV